MNIKLKNKLSNSLICFICTIGLYMCLVSLPNHSLYAIPPSIDDTDLTLLRI